MPGLNIADVVEVTVNLSPLTAPSRNFGILLLVGHTDMVIDTAERYRIYTTIDQVAGDFSESDPEYIAATLFFEQSPQPSILYIGRWAKTASAGMLKGGVLSASQQAMSNFTAITSGGFSITFDGGSATVLSGINLSAQTNLNGVASVIDAALPSGTTCTWNAEQGRFEIYSATTGASSSVTVMSTTALATAMGGTAAAGAEVIDGIAAETALAGLQAIAAETTEWYACMFALAADDDLNEAAYTAVANYIEAASPRHVFAINTQDTATIDPNDDTDIASVLGALDLSRTLVQYSSSSLNAPAALLAHMLTVDFTANNSMITLKFKSETGVTAEVLTETQATALNTKNCNVFAAYEGARSIIQQGCMVNGEFIDVIHGTDWLANAVQMANYNLLVTSPTKIPQTDAGVNQLMNATVQALQQGVFNGLIAPGQWNGGNIGRLKTGDYLPTGFYVYAPPIAQQLQSVREQRIAPTQQVAIKLAGAIHFADVIINVNR